MVSQTSARAKLTSNGGFEISLGAFTDQATAQNVAVDVLRSQQGTDFHDDGGTATWGSMTLFSWSRTQADPSPGTIDPSTYEPAAPPEIPVDDPTITGDEGVNIYGIDESGGDDEITGDPAFFGIGAGGVIAISSLLIMLPDSVKNKVMGFIAGISGLALGGRILWRAMPLWLRLLLIPLGLEGADILIDADLPTISDLPEVFSGGDNSSEIFPMGADVSVANWATSQHGPVVKTWMANGTPFVMFMDGYEAARRKNGTWHFWKPKKPLVYVPGGPMSRKTARRLATIYESEKKKAKATFNLINAKR